MRLAHVEESVLRLDGGNGEHTDATVALIRLNANALVCVVDGSEQMCGGRVLGPGRGVHFRLVVNVPLDAGVTLVARGEGTAQREALAVDDVRRLVVRRLELLKGKQDWPAYGKAVVSTLQVRNSVILTSHSRSGVNFVMNTCVISNITEK